MVAIEYTTGTFLIRIEGNFKQIGTFLAPYVQWLYPILVISQTPSSKKIKQDYSCALYSSLPIHGNFRNCPGLQGLYICHPLITSGHGLLRD